MTAFFQGRVKEVWGGSEVNWETLLHEILSSSLVFPRSAEEDEVKPLASYKDGRVLRDDVRVSLELPGGSIYGCVGGTTHQQ